jgi:hypothetical protein
MMRKTEPGIFNVGDSVCYLWKSKIILVGVVNEIGTEKIKLITPIGNRKVLKGNLYHWDETAQSFWSKQAIKIIESKTRIA